MPTFSSLLLSMIPTSFAVLLLLPFVGSSQEPRKAVSGHLHHHEHSQKLSPQLSFQITLHGFLHWASLGFLMPVGILIIRLSNGEKCGKRVKILFYLHVFLQIASVLLATAGAVMSIKNFENSFENHHQRLGLAIYAGIWVQPLIGFFRPQRGVKGRSIWFFVHWLLGTGISVLGIFNVYSGLRAYHKRTSRSVWLWNVLFSAEVSLIAFLYLLQDRWNYMQKQGVILGEEPNTPTHQMSSPRNNQKQSEMP